MGGPIKDMKNCPMGRQASSSNQGSALALSRGEINFLLDLQIAVLEDVSEAIEYDCNEDVLTIKRRVAHEGFSFLSKTLSRFNDEIFTSLSTGHFCSMVFKRKYKGQKQLALPSFLLGFTRLVFDIRTGDLLPYPSVEAIRSLRQVLTYLKKYETPLTASDQKAALNELIDIDSGLAKSWESYTPSMLDLRSNIVLSKARLLLDRLFHGFDVTDIMPKHGPGAVQEQIEQHEKYRFPQYSSVLDRSYPRDVYTVASLGQMEYLGIGSSRRLVAGERHHYKDYDIHPRQEAEFECGQFYERCARVSLVPKDSRGPRVIFIEPTGNQWIQGGLQRALQDWVERNALTGGQVNFKNQGINRELALVGSVSGDYATIDWSKASDRISRALVHALFPSHIYNALTCCASKYLCLKWPNGHRSYIKQNKFASMGNGLCFPVESLVFWALSVAALEAKGVKRCDALRSVWVYGDDVICNRPDADEILKRLPKFGLEYNESKTLVKGLFRESCGLDAYAGEEITPVKLKTRMPTGRKDVDGVTGWLDHVHLCVEHGLGRTATLCLKKVESILGELPVLPYKTAVLSLVSPDLCVMEEFEEEKPRTKPLLKGERWQTIQQLPFYQGRIVKGWVLKSRTYKPSLADFPDESAMMRYYSSRPSLESHSPYEKRHHIEAMVAGGSARVFAFPHQTKIKRGYTIVT